MTPEHRQLIDNALLVAANELAARARDLTPQVEQTVRRLALDELRASTLGRNLALLAHVVDGEPMVPRSRVMAAITFVQTALFVPLASPNHGADFVGMPPALQETPLGQLLNDARAQMLNVATAIPLGEAGRRLSLTKSSLYRLLDRGEIAVIDVGGRKLLSQEEYARLATRCEREREQGQREVGEGGSGELDGEREAGPGDDAK